MRAPQGSMKNTESKERVNDREEKRVRLIRNREDGRI